MAPLIHPGEFPKHLAERVRTAGDAGRRQIGSFVLYWMRTAVRAVENPALDLALLAGAADTFAQQSNGGSADPSDRPFAHDFREPLALNLGLLSQDPAEEQATPADEAPADQGGGGGEGSNPLSSVNKLDLIWTLTGAGGSQSHDVGAEGAFMLGPKLKLNYEVHYLFSDVIEDDWASVSVKPKSACASTRALCCLSSAASTR